MLEIVHAITNFFDCSDKDKEMFQKETDLDNELRAVKKYYYKGWTNIGKEMRGNISKYISIKNDIHVTDNLVFYENRLIVPCTMRSKILEILHEGHFGIN